MQIERVKWIQIDTATMPEKLARKYRKLRDGKITRKKFDAALIKLLKRKAGKPPAGKKYAISHSFGRLSFAIVSKPKRTNRLLRILWQDLTD